MKQTKKKTQHPLPKKTEQGPKDIETMLYETLFGPQPLVPYDYRQRYRYLTDSSQFNLDGASVVNIELGQGLPAIRVKQSFDLAYDGGLCGDSYSGVTIEVALYTLPIYKRVVVVYATNKQKDAACFEAFCQQQGIKYVKLDKPSKDKRETMQQWFSAIRAMDKLYRAKKGTKQCKE